MSTNSQGTRLAQVAALAMAIVAVGLMLGDPAWAEPQVGKNNHSAPTFTLDVRPPDRYEVQVLLRGPTAHGSRLTSATVFWGDGAHETKPLDPQTLYTQLGFRHRYAGDYGRSGYVRYGILARLVDEDGALAQQGDGVNIWARYNVTLNPVRFTSVDDCDYWSGDGEFEVRYQFEGDNDHRTFSVSADLGQGESFSLFHSPRTFYDVGQYDYPLFKFDWLENDFGLDPPMPTQLRNELHLYPVPGNVTREYEDSDSDDCTIRVRYTVVTSVVP